MAFKLNLNVTFYVALSEETRRLKAEYFWTIERKNTQLEERVFWSVRADLSKISLASSTYQW